MVSRGRVISRFGGRVVRLGLRVDRGTFIFDISNKSILVISSVGHSLDTAIGKSNLVRSRNGFAVSGLLGIEFGARVIISNTVLESIGFGCFIDVLGWVRGRGVIRSWGIGGGRGVVRSWGSSRGSNGNGHEGGKGSDAKHDYK